MTEHDISAETDELHTGVRNQLRRHLILKDNSTFRRLEKKSKDMKTPLQPWSIPLRAGW